MRPTPRVSRERGVARPVKGHGDLARLLDFDDPTYLRYLQIQRDAADRAGSNGYTLWNASGRYYMLP